MIDDEHKNDNNNNKKDEEINHENEKYFVSEEKLKTVFNEDKKLQLDQESSSDTTPQNKPHYEVKSQIIENIVDGLSPINISKEMRQSFLDYSMSVITARALPDARDGLKPVHRRILYSMHEQGIIASSAYKKSARIVGDVLGKYHPHGDSSVYEAMVRMAQDFSMRYLLVDGHGNYGSIDGDPAASMRYTEARMSKLSNEMVGDLRKQTVDFIDNYDGSEQEPVVLPTRIPNLLINGTTGIAVGMATNIPPHNLKETLNGIIALAKNPDLTIEELMQHIIAPDFPTGGLILFNENVKRAYETGRGSVTIRARTHIEELKNGKKCIVVTEIPFMVNKARLVEKIAELVKDKIIDGITDLRDESSRSGLRIVIEVRRDVFPEVLRNQLFKITSLQTNFPIQLLALVDGVPRTLNLKQICEIFINHQKDIVIRRTKFDLSKNQARAHVLEGLKIAVNSIDDIISIIKKSSDDKKAQETIQTTFNLSEVQSKAIIDMRLGRLTGLATEKMNDELHKVNLLINELSEILASSQKLIDVIVDEMNVNKGMFGDERRSEIVKGEIAIDNEDLIPQKDIAITMTAKGYVKRVALENFQIQHRGGVGTKAMTTYEDDDVDTILTTTTHTDLLVFTSFGKVYRIRAHQLPELSKQAKGVPFINLINIQKDEKVVALLTTNQYLPSQYLLTVTTKGIVKRTSLEDYSRINRNGKRALSLKDDDTLVTAMIVHNNDDIIIGSSNGSVVRFDVLTIRSMGRTAVGVRGISLQSKAIVVGASTSSSGSLILSIGQDGFGKLTPIDEYRKTNRGAKGVKSINIKKAGDLKFVSVVHGNEDILITTKQGITIRTNLSQVARSSRGTKGVKIISLNAHNAIKSVAVINTEAIKEQVNEAIRKTQEIELAKLNDLKLKNTN